MKREKCNTIFCALIVVAWLITVVILSHEYKLI
jgi:hypothetical protein